jgi:F-type H+-transporting ATPase subunit gamma
MAVGKEIRTKISSIKNTAKITKAMEMVAASKLRKSQTRMEAARPYADKIRNVISHVARAKSDYRHPFLEVRETKKVGLILITSDRGLCGGLNTNLFRNLTQQIKTWSDQGIGFEAAAFGNKGISFFKRMGGTVVASKGNLGDSPSLEDLIGGVKLLTDKFEAGEIDELYICYNELVNTMTQTPTIEQVLPVQKIEEEGLDESKSWDYIYEPSSAEILDALMMRYIDSSVYRAVVENIACEMSARMIAMKSATDNAGTLIDELQLIYNKARQASITQEISEIVSGAAAV